MIESGELPTLGSTFVPSSGHSGADAVRNSVTTVTPVTTVRTLVTGKLNVEPEHEHDFKRLDND